MADSVYRIKLELLYPSVGLRAVYVPGKFSFIMVGFTRRLHSIPRRINGIHSIQATVGNYEKWNGGLYNVQKLYLLIWRL